MPLFALIVALVLIVLGLSQQSSSSDQGSADVTQPNQNPSGAIIAIAQAIAKKEGFGVNPTNGPTRNNNPGDISDGANTFGYDPLITDSKVTTFPDANTGWQWLYGKLTNIANGVSRVYSPDMTWIQFGHKWASDPSWGFVVAEFLGVDPNSTFADFIANYQG